MNSWMFTVNDAVNRKQKMSEKGVGLVSAFYAMADWSFKWLAPSNLANTKSKSKDFTNKQ
jgi:hypothetical protein